jgi:hypothetical protein
LFSYCLKRHLKTGLNIGKSDHCYDGKGLFGEFKVRVDGDGGWSLSLILAQGGCQLNLKRYQTGIDFVVVAIKKRRGGVLTNVVTVMTDDTLGVTLGGAVLTETVLVRGHLATTRQSLSGLKRCAADGLETNEAIHDGLI